jgi:hypothetical protein
VLVYAKVFSPLVPYLKANIKLYRQDKGRTKVRIAERKHLKGQACNLYCISDAEVS